MSCISDNDRNIARTLQVNYSVLASEINIGILIDNRVISQYTDTIK